MEFHLPAYLARIGLDRCTADGGGLAALQASQLAAMTFENVDPFLGIVPDLSKAALWRKLVEEHRGGYCFELNGLFGQALAAAGFASRPILARVLSRMPDSARTHLAHLVTIEGQEWLSDVGFGGPGAHVPLRLDDGLRQEDGRTAYRLVECDGEWLLEHEQAGKWAPLYQFDRGRVSPMDVEAANFVCAHWEMAPFRDNLMLSRQAPGRRVSLFNRVMKTETAGGGSRQERLGDREALAAALRGPFCLRLSEDTVDRIWHRLAGT